MREGIDVAVKLIEEAVGGGFEEEVRLLSRCRHPNVVMLLGFAQDDDGIALSAGGAPAGRCALVYELLPGGDAHRRLAPQFAPGLRRLRAEAPALSP